MKRKTMKTSPVRRTAVAVLAAAALALTGCSAGGGSDSGPIKIGASLPITGPLASFGGLIQTGYRAAIDDVNASGGLSIGGSKRKVQLIVRDSKSDPDTVSQQSRTLVLNDEVVALLGSVSPPLTIPASNIAERQKVPFVTSLTPLEAWKGGNPSGWKYSYDLFFDEKTMTSRQFQVSDLAKTNKKVALFTDNEEDGITMGKLWEAKAPTMGYEIAYHAEFPVGTTDYSSFIQKAKNSGAQVLIAQMIPPDAFALWKQMKALSFQPQTAFCEKCGAQAAFQQQLKGLAEGTMTTDFVQPSENKDYQSMVAKYGAKYGKNLDLSSAIIAQSAAKIMLDAIARAGSTDPAKINAALAKTSGEYSLGSKVEFAKDHTFAVPPIAVQWRGTETKAVYPKSSDSVDLVAPVAGLR